MHRGTLLAAGTAALVLFGAACDDDDEPTGVGSPASIRIVSGCTNVSAGAGLALTDPVVVQVLDSRGNPVPNVTVTFAASAGGGSPSPTSATTNSQGQAQTTFTLGTTAGANTLTATTAGVTTGATCSATGLARFTTQLRTSNEPSLPTPAPNAQGSSSVVLSADEQTLTVTVVFQGLSGNANAAHIHGPFTPGGTATSAGVILGFPNFPAAQSGTYTQTFTAATAAVGGGLTWAQLIDNIKQGRTYVNVHTGGNPAGEIRGQLATP